MNTFLKGGIAGVASTFFLPNLVLFLAVIGVVLFLLRDKVTE